MTRPGLGPVAQRGSAARAAETKTPRHGRARGVSGLQDRPVRIAAFATRPPPPRLRLAAAISGLSNGSIIGRSPAGGLREIATSGYPTLRLPKRLGKCAR